MIGIKESKQKTITPHLGKSGLFVFEDYVSKANGYLEYGSGGSTLTAQRLGAKHIISVDSSKAWYQNIGVCQPSWNVNHAASNVFSC